MKINHNGLLTNLIFLVFILLGGGRYIMKNRTSISRKKVVKKRKQMEPDTVKSDKEEKPAITNVGIGPGLKDLENINPGNEADAATG